MIFQADTIYGVRLMHYCRKSDDCGYFVIILCNSCTGDPAQNEKKQ